LCIKKSFSSKNETQVDCDTLSVVLQMFDMQHGLCATIATSTVDSSLISLTCVSGRFSPEDRRTVPLQW